MKTFPTASGRSLLIVLIYAGACLIGLGESSGQSSPISSGSAQEYEFRCLTKMRGLMASHPLDERQSFCIEYLLREQNAMVDLFAKHGLLSEKQLREKISTIVEVTRSNVDGVLTPDQLAIWHAWDLKLDTVGAENSKVHRRLLATP